MDQEIIKAFDEDIEDGEVSDSDDVYTPLARPGTTAEPIIGSPPLTSPNVPVKMEETIEDSASDFGASSSSTSDSDDCLNIKKNLEDAEESRKKKTKRTILLRVKADNELQDKRARFKKYDIWSSSLQEDVLTEDMRGIGVANDARQDRSVESYDYKAKYRLSRENTLKRRLSTSSDEHSENDLHQQVKRSRAGGIKSRLGQRTHRQSENSSDYDLNGPRHIRDLDEPIEGRPPQEIAHEMANRLYEEKDDLLVRIVEIVGPDLVVQLFKETQRIESDGGMMILNGKRRRTPGGVFLFLIKNSERITPDEKKLIFFDEQKTANRIYKEIRAIKRHRKVEELKKRLSAKEKHLPALASRKEIYLGSELKAELKSTLSNPPPSPVGLENSPEYKSHAINHVGSDTSPEKPSTSKVIIQDTQLTCHEDDFLDIHCADMDFF